MQTHTYICTEIGREKQNRIEQNRTEQNRTEQNRTEQNRAEHNTRDKQTTKKQRQDNIKVVVTLFIDYYMHALSFECLFTTRKNICHR